MEHTGWLRSPHLFCQENDAHKDDQGTKKGWVASFVAWRGVHRTYDFPSDAGVVQEQVEPAEAFPGHCTHGFQ